MAWRYFQKDQHVGYLKIVRLVQPGKRQIDTTYEAIKTCCGIVAVLRHDQIIRPSYLQSEVCIACQRRSKAAQKAEQSAAPAPVADVKDASGWLWCKLGKLGMRGGMNGPNVATGAAA